MLDKIPTEEELCNLMGRPLLSVWNALCGQIDAKYDMDHIWNTGGKAWDFEYKFRRGGKTLCALYARKNELGFLIIFGKMEQSRFEADRERYSPAIQKIYDETNVYHDGKWMMFPLTDTSLFPDMERLLFIKRKPNRKG
ncbi:DUF3788 domain-containing protein [Anaerolentibacter hominis]|uniref:DUF3788 domain-containing protein n=1 Tax=Anaerolentibacter hominis TaxID=3079009 RepID=UPI0031B89167